MICLFTDFGAADLYVGQVKAVLHQHAPEARVVAALAGRGGRAGRIVST